MNQNGSKGRKQKTKEIPNNCTLHSFFEAIGWMPFQESFWFANKVACYCSEMPLAKEASKHTFISFAFHKLHCYFIAAVATAKLYVLIMNCCCTKNNALTSIFSLRFLHPFFPRRRRDRAFPPFKITHPLYKKGSTLRCNFSSKDDRCRHYTTL